MANEEHLALLRLGLLDPQLDISALWNQWREDNPDIIPDLSHAQLKPINLFKINFSRANLNGTLLKNAILSRADFREANLGGADLRGANLGGADLSRTQLLRANLSDAYLATAYLYGANLSGANLSRGYLHHANLTKVKLLRANLSGANLHNTYLYGANLLNANLCGANLSHLSGTELMGVNLKNTDLRNLDVTGVGLMITRLLKAYGGQLLFVSGIYQDTPAKKAGIRLDDRIGSINQQNTDSMDMEVVHLLLFDKPGTKVTLTIKQGLGSNSLQKEYCLTCERFMIPVQGLSPEQVKQANNWKKAHYEPEFRFQLGLPPESTEVTESN